MGADIGGNPIVIGLYGIQGSGKSHALEKLKTEIGLQELCLFFDGSEVIESTVPGGLSAFKLATDEEKHSFREQAIRSIASQCAKAHKAAVVAGHYMFYDAESHKSVCICTEADLEIYTHVIYLDVDPVIVHQRRREDKQRSRGELSVDQLRQWKNDETARLRETCLEQSILFTMVHDGESPVTTQIRDLILNFAVSTEQKNDDFVKQKVQCMTDEISCTSGPLKKILLLDADKTLAAVDTGDELLSHLAEEGIYTDPALGSNPLVTIFRSRIGQSYSYDAFHQVCLFYEETLSDDAYYNACYKVAMEVTLYPEILEILRQAMATESTGIVVVTCGIPDIWRTVLKNHHLGRIHVVGGCRLAHDYIVTPKVKGNIARCLRDNGITVCAFGDSPMDVPMMKEAHESIVVVGDKATRSKSMDAVLQQAITEQGLHASQLLVGGCQTPRLDPGQLPIVNMGHEFVNHICSSVPKYQHLTGRNTAMLLTGHMRNATMSGPGLRESHRQAGWYISTELLPCVAGFETYNVPHVQGNQTKCVGHRLMHESKTVIVPLMRGGEPMAFGVNDAFPLATFVHAKNPEDLKKEHLWGMHTVVLVDSVVNTGGSVIEFVQHIRSMNATTRIVLVAGVVQEKAITDSSSLGVSLKKDGALHMIALRTSANKYTGSGTTDTGNRLFNTTFLR